jgi:hypothetical protein
MRQEFQRCGGPVTEAGSMAAAAPPWANSRLPADKPNAGVALRVGQAPLHVEGSSRCHRAP